MAVTINGSGTITGVPIGKILQVVTVTKSTSFATSSTSYVDATGVTLSITPTSISSKVMVFLTVSGASSVLDKATWYQILRDATSVGVVLSSTFATSGTVQAALTILDSPATTSAVTYKLQMKTQSANSSTISGNSDNTTLTVMEVAA
jgi:hypothetical protein